MSAKTPAWQEDALIHAHEAYPRESCGLVVAGEYIACTNEARGTEHFQLSARDYAAAEERGTVEAVVHSHPDASANPSPADRVACEQTGLPWHIVGIPSEVWKYCEPEGYTAPLVGRPFYHGVLDCYSLIRDWYARERGIALPDFAREDEWWLHGGDLYQEHFVEAGFEASCAASARPGDVLLMQIAAPVPNHAAIWLAGDVILHHLYGRLSCHDVYGGYWRKHTTHWLTYVGGGA